MKSSFKQYALSLFGIIVVFVLTFAPKVSALDEDIADTFRSLLRSGSRDQSTPSESAPQQSNVAPSFERVLIGNSPTESILLGNDEVSGIVTSESIGLGISTSGILGIGAASHRDTASPSSIDVGIYSDNSQNIGSFALSNQGTGLRVDGIIDSFGLFTSGKSVGLYSRGNNMGFEARGTTFGGSLGISTDTNGIGIFGIGSTSGIEAQDGSRLGTIDFGFFSSSDAVIGSMSSQFVVENDASFIGDFLVKSRVRIDEVGEFTSYVDASRAKSLQSTLHVAGPVTLKDNLNIQKNLESADFIKIGGDFLFRENTTENILRSRSSSGVLGIDDDVLVHGDVRVQTKLTANSMGNISIHQNNTEGNEVTVSCESRETLMGCGASIDGGSEIVDRVYPSNQYCVAERENDSSYDLRVYAYCFEPGGLGSESCEDTDGDGVCDVDDNCVSESNSNQNDVDGDGIGDVCDNCVTKANSSQTDSDSDGIGDACESTVPEPVEPCGSHPDPTCGNITIPFNPTYRNDDIWEWNWKPEYIDTTTRGDVAHTDDCSFWCPDEGVTEHALTDSNSYLYGWTGVGLNRQITGDMTVFAAAFMVQRTYEGSSNSLDDQGFASISDADLKDAIDDFLSENSFNEDGSIDAGRGWDNLDNFRNEVVNSYQNLGLSPDSYLTKLNNLGIRYTDDTQGSVDDTRL